MQLAPQHAALQTRSSEESCETSVLIDRLSQRPGAAGGEAAVELALVPVAMMEGAADLRLGGAVHRYSRWCILGQHNHLKNGCQATLIPAPPPRGLQPRRGGQHLRV